MPRRSTTLTAAGTVDITRDINSRYDTVKEVADNIDAIVALAGVDSQELLSLLEEATNFTGLTVVSGTPTGWNPATKVLTIETVQGIKGDTGSPGIDGNNGLTPYFTFEIDNEGNLTYDVSYEAGQDVVVEEW